MLFAAYYLPLPTTYYHLLSPTTSYLCTLPPRHHLVVAQAADQRGHDEREVVCWDKPCTEHLDQRRGDGEGGDGHTEVRVFQLQTEGW